jgi:hypothetical protein
MNAPAPKDLAMSWRIRLEQPGDAARVEALNAESFGPGRFAKSAYRLREGVDPVAALSFVAVEMVDGAEALRGSVRFWPVRVGGHEELLLGPLAVHGSQRERDGPPVLQGGEAFGGHLARKRLATPAPHHVVWNDFRFIWSRR